ncbi:MmgE/PrpD family protein [Starkeya sp. 3C]|uniref:MmgE/PrpD family protein n=1 Tax=Ancylobacter moscoviensis TaxID=2597768 RepID=A0ABY3DT11_9HYPH|nr:MmgE/PrpD family protein [Ancylobacter moscoviensis]TSJ62611.1 MmgE/PrpD family protein [Ancylobacter moscoviensis]
MEERPATAIERMARWACGLRPGDVPAPVQRVARNCLIDTLGVALAGSATPVARRARGVLADIGAVGEAQLLGSAARLAAPGAAAANATAAHALDFDDNCYSGVVHGSAVIVPAALAVAQSVGASGAALIEAIVAGSEAEYALGAGMTMALYERGWWTTAVLGPVGASVAAARLYGLDARATGAAIGIALAGTGGAKAAFGTDAKPVLAGRAAEAGVIAAFMARAGVSGPLDAVEHPRGFAGLFNGGVREDEAFATLGRTWRLLEPGIDVKRIPVCLSSHAAVDVVDELARTHDVEPGEIVHIACDVPPVVIANLIYDLPANRQQAQFSMPFAIAATLVFGEVRLRHLDDAVLADPALARLLPRISMQTGERWDEAARRAAPEGAHVTLLLRDGRRLEGFRAFPRGAAADPLSDQALAAKFLDCAASVTTPADAASLLDRLGRIETLADVTCLLPLCDET